MAKKRKGLWCYGNTTPHICPQETTTHIKRHKSNTLSIIQTHYIHREHTLPQTGLHSKLKLPWPPCLQKTGCQSFYEYTCLLRMTLLSLWLPAPPYSHPLSATEHQPFTITGPHRWGLGIRIITNTLLYCAYSFTLSLSNFVLLWISLYVF